MSEPRNQSGNVIVYTVVAVALLAILAGAFYVAKQRAANSTGNQPEVVQTPDEALSNTDKSKDKDSAKQSDSSSKDQAKNSGAADQTGSAKSSPKQSTGSQASLPADGSKAGGSADGNSKIAPAGPTDTIGSVVGLAALSAATAAYLRSRRRISPLA